MSSANDQPAAPSGFFSLDNLKWLIEKLTLPLVLAAITIVFQWNANQRSRAEIAAADQRAQAESRSRLYTELLHKREDADTAVRRAVFDKLMDRYLSPDPKDLDDKLVALELLAVNFHDSLNLSPLFWQIDRQITTLGSRANPQLREHLTRVSQGVKDRQMAFLAPEDFAKPLPVELAAVPSIALPTEGCVAVEALAQSGQGSSMLEVNAGFADNDAKGLSMLHQRRFSIAVDCKDPLQQRLRLIVSDVATSRRWIFWVDLYDFPLVTFTPLLRDERFALVLDRYDDGFGLAWLRLAYFPASRSGAKDKPHVADVMARLSIAPPTSEIALPPMGAGRAPPAPR
jgi:hypothetical protein